MADSNDIQALETISTQVDNFQVKNLISNQCIKAQEFLCNKISKECKRQKELCRFIGGSNLNLVTEITLAEQKIKSLNIAIETIKIGNIELNKEYLLSKERKGEIFERIEIGKKKYENLWLVSEKRYQSIPTVRQLIQLKNDNEIIQTKINAITNEHQNLVKQIKIKKNNFEAIDRARIIELARFFVEERSQMLLKINENDFKIKQVLHEIETLTNEQISNPYNTSQTLHLPNNEKQRDAIKDASLGDNWPDLNRTAEKDILMLPKLSAPNNELDILSVKLDELKKVNLQNTLSMKRPSTSGDVPYKRTKREQQNNENFILSYFDISLNNTDKDDRKIDSRKYSEKKLIHILEDIKLDKNEAFKIVKKLEPTQLQVTKYIHRVEKITNSQGKENKSMEIEEIVDLTNNIDADIVNPPTQFLDSQISQEKKTVLLNIPNESEMSTDQTEEKDKGSLQQDVSISEEIEIIKSQERNILNNSTSNDNFTMIKDMLLKKHNLDLSPDFVYSKNTLMQKQYEDEVTSKFFERNAEVTQHNIINTIDDYDKNKENKMINNYGDKQNLSSSENVICAKKSEVSSPSPKEHIKDNELPVSGFLFKHGHDGITNSLNVSINTSGLDDFPHCVDPSLLLSPKANLLTPAECSNNNEVISQEVPNFMTGFRKTGLSFFGGTTSSDKPDAAEHPCGSFNFSFGKEEKKGRGGLFSMFH